MLYTVTAFKAALVQLGVIYNSSSDKAAVSLASNEIDDLLRKSPFTAGVPFGKYFRVVVPPLQVIYSISPLDCLVEIKKYDRFP
jgi:hypothetical protein